MKIKSILLLLFLLINSVSFGQIFDLNSTHPYKKVFVETDDFGVSYLDSLESNLKNIKQDTIYYNVLNDLAYYWHTRNLNTSLEYINKGLQLTSTKKDSLWNGRFQITQGAILLRMEKLDSAFTVLEDAKLKVNKKDLPFLNTQLGYVFERRGELDKAADYALEAMSIGEELGDTNAQAVAYSDLSNLFWKQSKFDKGVEFGLKSIELFEENNINNLDYDFTIYVVGNNYLELKKYKEALNYFERSIAIGERYGFYNNLSDVYISLTDLHTYLGDFDSAKKAGENAVKYAELLENNFMIMRSWLAIGKSELKANHHSKAIASIKKCIEVATEIFGDEYYLSNAYKTLAEAYAEGQDFEKAYQAYKEYERLKNAIFTAESDQRISLLQTEFDVALKEDTIKIQNNIIEQQHARQQLVLIIGGLLLLLLVVLYVTYRLDKKKNKLLQKQHDENVFLLKEIHHRVKNNLEVVSSLLSLQSEKLQNKNAKDALLETQNRVHSMSMIHQRLYKGKNISTIEMKDYFINLGNHILDSFGANNKVNLEYMMSKIELDVDTAIPLGLIVNELLTNALKYAFSDDRKGLIKIGVNRIDSETLELKVSDNGVGFTKNEAVSTGFGRQLITLLIQQLEGELQEVSEIGTSISFKFKSTKMI